MEVRAGMGKWGSLVGGVSSSQRVHAGTPGGGQPGVAGHRHTVSRSDAAPLHAAPACLLPTEPLLGSDELWGVALAGPPAGGAGQPPSHFRDGLSWMWRQAAGNNMPALVVRAGDEWRQCSPPGLPSRTQQTAAVLYLLRMALALGDPRVDNAALAGAALFYILHAEVKEVAGEDAAEALASGSQPLLISLGWFDFLLSTDHRHGAPYRSVLRCVGWGLGWVGWGACGWRAVPAVTSCQPARLSTHLPACC